MNRRLFVLILATVAVALPCVAPALDVAPDLQAALAAKTDGGTLPVMLLLPDAPDLTALEPTLAGLTPASRRAAVIAALRAHAQEAEAPARVALADAAKSGRVERLRSLFVAGALLFDADAAAIDVLAASKAAGELHHDKSYDLLAGVTAPKTAATPADPAAKVDTDAWGVDYIGANTVWGMGYTGTGVVVGHIDSGIWLTHPDIVNRLWTNPGEIAGNAIDDDGNGYVDDVHGYDFGDNDGDPNDDSASPGHGTHTAGTVCGDGTNGTHTGVAPGAQIMAIKAFASDGTGTLGMIWEGYQYVLVNGARIITMSLGVPGDLPASLMRTERQTDNVMRVAGVTIFNAAGNDHFNYSPPIELGLTARVPAPWNPIAGTPYSSTSGVVTVGGTGYMSDANYSSSSRGPADWGPVDPWNDWPYNPGAGLTKPDVCAPAVNVNSLVPPDGYSGNTWSGTSMATPHAAGLAALLLDKNPTLSPAGLDSIMELSCVPLGVAGKDVIYGSGRIDAVAAINLTPTTSTPHLSWDSFAIQDAGGDGVIDPGEAFELVVTLVNNSPVVDATGVTGGMAVVAGGPITVADGSGTFGTVAMSGGTADNAGDVFGFTCDGGANQGDTFTMLLTVTAQNGYQKTMDVEWYVGLPEWRTHDVGNVQGTVTDNGSLGFLDATQVDGNGFGPEGGHGLFIGSFWGGTSATYICNHDYDEGTPYDWVTVTSPNGRVKDNGNVISDQDFEAIFSDAGNAAPVPLTVTQESFAFAAPPNDDFIVLRYTVYNGSASDVTGYYAGVFCDWDIDDAAANLGAADATRRLTYMYPSAGGAYFGIALLSPTSASALRFLNNPTYVYPNGYIADANKARAMKGLLGSTAATPADDWSALTAAGPVTIPAGSEVEFVFALVWGQDLADIQANTDAAQAVDLTAPDAIAEGPLPSARALAQNAPNPFNPQTTIRFTTDRDTRVRLGVYDLGGRLVRRLADRVFVAGGHDVVWNGRNDAGDEMPSGLYLYRYEDGRRTETRKMMLVR